MKRRNFIGTSAAGLASTSALGSCGQTERQSSGQPGQTDQAGQSEPVSTALAPIVEWRMATSWPKSINIIPFGAANTIASRVKEMTGGRFVITPYSVGEVTSALGVFDATRDGTVECGHSIGSYYVAENPVFGIGGLPFGMNAQQQTAWLYQGGGLDLLQTIYAEYGIINFPTGHTGLQMGGWFKNKIDSLADLKGLKMRIPGMGAEVMKRLGVEPIALPPGETFAALESGKIEAAELGTPYGDEKMGLYHLAPYYYYPGWWETGSFFEIYVNLDAWNQLPKAYQAIFKSATIDAHIQMLAKLDTENGAALKRLINRGTMLLPFSQEILRAAHKVAIELQEETAAQHAEFKTVYDHWQRFRDQIFQWHGLNELSYANFAFGSGSTR